MAGGREERKEVVVGVLRRWLEVQWGERLLIEKWQGKIFLWCILRFVNR